MTYFTTRSYTSSKGGADGEVEVIYGQLPSRASDNNPVFTFCNRAHLKRFVKREGVVGRDFDAEIGEML